MTDFVRDFSVKQGVIRTALGSCDINGAMTVVALVKFNGNNNEWLWSRVSATNSNSGEWTNLGKESGHIHFQPGGNPGVSFPAGSNWALVVASCPAGTATRRYYIKVFPSEEWFVEEDTATHALTHSGTPARIQFGRWNGTEQFKGRMAAMAVFPIAFGEAEAKELAALPSIKDWLGLFEEFELGPVGLWMFNQASITELVIDQTGNGADEIEGASVETGVTEESPPIPYEPEGGGAKVIKPGTAKVTGFMLEPSITITEPEPEPEPPLVIEPEAALVTFSAPTGGEVAVGPLRSPTNDGRTGGLPLPFPSVLANPGRLGPPRFNNRDRRALGL